MTKTLKAAREFQHGMRAIEDYPLEDIRGYIINRKEIPASIKEKVDYLQKIRSEAIAGEMYYLKEKAERAGVKLPEDFLDGTAIDPVLEPEIYRISENFGVFGLFLWFKPDEIARFSPRKII